MPVIPLDNGLFRTTLQCSFCGRCKCIDHWEDLTDNLEGGEHVPYHCGFCEYETIQLLAHPDGRIVVNIKEITSIETIPRGTPRSKASIVSQVCRGNEEIRYTKKGKKIRSQRVVKRRVPTLFTP